LQFSKNNNQNVNTTTANHQQTTIEPVAPKDTNLIHNNINLKNQPNNRDKVIHMKKIIFLFFQHLTFFFHD
jgi:hypothetical protein